MKTFSALALLVALGCVALTPHAFGQADSTITTSSITNAVGKIPQSHFDENAGKDPFFPRRSAAAVPKAAANEVRMSDFTLKGITPFGTKPTAIINGYTFEKGESHEVKVSSGGKVMIHCIDIKDGVVIITIEKSPQQVELRMRPGF